jgi:hypothetical protein
VRTDAHSCSHGLQAQTITAAKVAHAMAFTGNVISTQPPSAHGKHQTHQADLAALTSQTLASSSHGRVHGHAISCMIVCKGACSNCPHTCSTSATRHAVTALSTLQCEGNFVMPEACFVLPQRLMEVLQPVQLQPAWQQWQEPFMSVWHQLWDCDRSECLPHAVNSHHSTYAITANVTSLCMCPELWMCLVPAGRDLDKRRNG